MSDLEINSSTKPLKTIEWLMSTLTLRKPSLNCIAKELVALAIIANVISPAKSEDGQAPTKMR